MVKYRGGRSQRIMDACRRLSFESGKSDKFNFFERIFVKLKRPSYCIIGTHSVQHTVDEQTFNLISLPEPCSVEIPAKRTDINADEIPVSKPVSNEYHTSYNSLDNPGDDGSVLLSVEMDEQLVEGNYSLSN